MLLGVALSQLGLASPALAATVRYASPTGTSSQNCLSMAAACSIDKAINLAGSGNEVVITPGSYTTSTVLKSSAASLNVHGVLGQPRPVINTTADIGLQLFGSASKVSDLTIVGTGSQWGLNLFASGITVERVEVRTSAQIACGLGYSGTVRDSLCVTSSANGVALKDEWGMGGGPLLSGLLEVRNVTAIATGGSSYGIRAEAGDFANLDINARNVIASGTLADLGATKTLVGGSDSDIALNTSNYDVTAAVGTGVTITPAGTGTNQTAAPVYAETVSYHQGLHSPTIDAGSVDSKVGSIDLDGTLRRIGPAVDIGATEYVPDTTAPDVMFDRVPKPKINKRKVTFEFHASEVVTFVCTLDTKAPRVCTSPVKLKPRKRGKHTLTVVATDPSGNVDPTPSSYTWKVRKHAKHKHRHHHGHHHHGQRLG